MADHQLLNNLKLEFKCDFASSCVTTDDDLDADMNYYNTLFNNPVNYYETTNLNPITPQPTTCTPQFCMHINARSLSKNINNITTELSLLSNKPSVLAITETWAVSDNDHFPIIGYSSILKARKNKIGGGVGLYLQDKIDLKYKLRSDLFIDDTSDSLFIQTTTAKMKNIIIGVIYKPPDVDVVKFNENLEKTLKIITKERRPFYLLGDFNINLLKQNLHSPTKHFLVMLLAHGFFPLIYKPTRITTESVTSTDNIFTNVHDLQTRSGTWIVDISDHLPVFTVLPNKVKNCEIKTKISKRSFTQNNLDKFRLVLQTYDWSNLDDIQDVNSMYSSFIHTVQKLYDKSFPILIKTVTAPELYKPWLTKAIRNSIRKKHSFYSKPTKKSDPLNRS